MEFTVSQPRLENITHNFAVGVPAPRGHRVWLHLLSHDLKRTLLARFFFSAHAPECTLSILNVIGKFQLCPMLALNLEPFFHLCRSTSCGKYLAQTEFKILSHQHLGEGQSGHVNVKPLGITRSVAARTTTLPHTPLRIF
jgi:hypothetical protein